MIFGYSCGHDFDFHVLNWMEVAAQWHQGILYPHWAASPAYGAGEPRFVFYPPLSWMLGALLGIVLPWNATPAAYTFIVMLGCGLSMNRLARQWTSPDVALLAAVLYMGNPYLLFVAYERTAYAELMAAVWLPVLFLAILRRDATIRGIAIPVALLWLTNAPAAVMGCYALAFIAAVRVAAAVVDHPAFNKARTLRSKLTAQSSKLQSNKALSRPDTNAQSDSNPPLDHDALLPNPANAAPPARLAFEFAAGTLLGLALAAFYIVPAAYERPWVQIQLAMVPGMRIQDNFLFGHTADPNHDGVLWTASWICVTLLVASAIAAAVALRRLLGDRPSEAGGPCEALNRHSSVDWPASTSLARNSEASDAETSASVRYSTIVSLSALALLILFLQLPLSAPVWHYLPELGFLQFPWRWLAILSVAMVLLLAFAVRAPRRRNIPIAAAILLPIALIPAAYRLFHQACEPDDTIPSRLQLFNSGAGSEPTDEYTPQTADNDVLHPGVPLASVTNSIDGALLPAGNDVAIPVHTAEHWQLTVNMNSPQFLVLRLREYPAWRVRIDGAAVADRPERDDGLIVLPLAAGHSDIDLRYATTTDQRIGDAISLLAVLALLLAHPFKKFPKEPAAEHEAL